MYTTDFVFRTSVTRAGDAVKSTQRLIPPFTIWNYETELDVLAQRDPSSGIFEWND